MNKYVFIHKITLNIFYCLKKYKNNKIYKKNINS